MLPQAYASSRTRLQTLIALIILFLLFAAFHFDKSQTPFLPSYKLGQHPRICLNPQNNVSSIPPIIHQNFFTSSACNSSSPNCLARKESYAWQTSPFQYKFYSEAAARQLLPLLAEKLPRDSKYTAEEYIEIWDSLPESILRADFWRYIALFMFGGIYADLDVKLETPLPWQVLCDHDAWPGKTMEDGKDGRMPESVAEGNGSGNERRLKGKSDVETRLIIGIEDERDSDHDSSVPREIQINTWTIVAAPLHPVMLSIMDHIVTEAPAYIKRLEEGTKVQEIIMDFTGPSIFTDIILEWVDSNLEQGVLAKDGLHQLQKPRKMYDTLFLPRLAFGIVPEMPGSKETGVLVRHGYAGSWIINEDGGTGHK